MYYPVNNTDATAEEVIKRPINCVVRDVPSIGNTYGNFSNPSSNISRFDENSPIIQRYKSRLIDLLYEATSQQYIIPESNSLESLVRSFLIVDGHKLGIKSLAPLPEGGVEFDMKYLNKYIHIQFYNEGESAVYLENEGSTPQGWDLSHESTLTKLQELLA